MAAERVVPVSSGQKVVLEISGLTDKGEGVGRCEGFAVFIPGALTGERVEAQITEVKKSFARARLVKVVSAAENRIQPACRIFDQCGGCQLQHLDYDGQLKEKRQQVIDNLLRIGGLPEETVRKVRPVIGMDKPFNYRNKVHLQVCRIKEENGKSVIRLGYYKKGSHDFIGMNNCLLADHDLNLLAAELEKLLNRFDCPLYDWRSNKGYLRCVMLRKAVQSNQLMVVLVTGSQNWINEQQLAKQLLDNCSGKLKSVIRNINTRPERIVLGNKSLTLAGQDYITDILCGIKFKISSQSFYQINPAQTKKLYSKAIEFAELKKSDIVADAFCGIGTISLLAAQQAAMVYGIEEMTQAVENAEQNAQLNAISNVTFITGKVEEELPVLMKKARPDVLFLDPPRKGCEAQLLQTVIEQEIERVVYVSCNPATLARDAAVLVKGGYQLQEAVPVDMFGQTGHVETVCCLTRM